MVSKRTMNWVNHYCSFALEDPTEGPLAGVNCEAEITLMKDNKSKLSAINRRMVLAIMEARLANIAKEQIAKDALREAEEKEEPKEVTE